MVKKLDGLIDLEEHGLELEIAPYYVPHLVFL
jgi:hypothetical protein